MKIVCVQLDPAWENKAANFRRVRELLGAAPFSPGSLVLLPEMFATGFSMNAEAIAEKPGGETEQFLARTAREFGIFLVGGMAASEAGGRKRNQAVAFDPDGRELARYSKRRCFPLAGEARHYAAGDQVATFRWHDWVVAPFVCYDLRFPELFREAARQGAHLFAILANWPAPRIPHWVTLLQARAIENQAFVAGVNRCGRDPLLYYSGRSLVIDPQGEILADAGESPQIVSATVDLAALKTWRAEFPALADMQG